MVYPVDYYSTGRIKYRHFSKCSDKRITHRHSWKNSFRIYSSRNKEKTSRKKSVMNGDDIHAFLVQLKIIFKRYLKNRVLIKLKMLSTLSLKRKQPYIQCLKSRQYIYNTQSFQKISKPILRFSVPKELKDGTLTIGSYHQFLMKSPKMMLRELKKTQLQRTGWVWEGKSA